LVAILGGVVNAHTHDTDLPGIHICDLPSNLVNPSPVQQMHSSGGLWVGVPMHEGLIQEKLVQSHGCYLKNPAHLRFVRSELVHEARTNDPDPQSG